MRIRHTIEGSKLILTADDGARKELAEMKEDAGGQFGDRQEVEALESLIANSELDWINPKDTGDLTEAPMLGVFGEEFTSQGGLLDRPPLPDGALGAVQYGQNGDVGFWMPILRRWAFADYQVRSFLDDLLSEGRAEFVS